jgi:hypothetical protein
MENRACPVMDNMSGQGRERQGKARQGMARQGKGGRAGQGVNVVARQCMAGQAGQAGIQVKLRPGKAR